MRLALAALLFASSIACTNARQDSRTAVEHELNAHLDRQLHKTLQKLIATETAQASPAAMTSDGHLLTQR